MTLILALDASGSPARWLSPEKAAFYYAKGLVAWELGDDACIMHGGTNARSGLLSALPLKSIVAISGKAFFVGGDRTPSVERDLVFRRDRHICAYCGDRFRESELTLDHVLPESRGGNSVWENLTAACRRCNGRKNDKTPEEARMPLLYVPYAPNKNEAFILANRKIKSDQMLFLLAGVPKHSRLHA